jgi:hypothetical protein
MDMYEDRTMGVRLAVKPSEHKALADYARANELPTLSAAIRHALPEVFREQAREGRKPGFSPKRKAE